MVSRKIPSESVGLMRQSSLINSLGNAGHENSFLLLKSYTESKHAPSLLRRSAVHSLRSYHTDEVCNISFQHIRIIWLNTNLSYCENIGEFEVLFYTLQF